MVEEGLIKKQKDQVPIHENEKPFALPSSWKWHRLQESSEYIQRGKGPKYADQGSVRVVSQKCVQWSGFNTDLARYILDSSLEKYQPERFIRSNDLLWNSTGTGTVGRVNRIKDAPPNSLVADSHVTIVRSLLKDSSVIFTYLSSAGVQSRVEPTHSNPLVSGTTNQVELNTSAVNSLPVPLPPLPEQHRIVAKVDELMELCDQLKASLATAQATQLNLTDSLVERAIG
jgi:type I restriction enzyme S subunit